MQRATSPSLNEAFAQIIFVCQGGRAPQLLEMPPRCAARLCLSAPDWADAFRSLNVVELHQRAYTSAQFLRSSRAVLVGNNIAEVKNQGEPPCQVGWLSLAFQFMRER